MRGKNSLKQFEETECIYCDKTIKLPKLKGIRYLKWAAVHTEHDKKTKI